MEQVITGAFAEFLKENRYSLNLKFANAKRIQPNLDSNAFSDLLRQEVAIIIDIVDRYNPAATKQVSMVLYDLTLNLLSKDFIGPNSRFPLILKGWQELLPSIPQYLTLNPRLVIGTITNALYNLSLETSARSQEWLDLMHKLAPLANDAKIFLQAGQVAAWRVGLSHFREGALDLCRKLPRFLVNIALGLTDSSESFSIETIVNRLISDPWLHPSCIGDNWGFSPSLKIVKRAGAFRGFGGLFRQPPTVACAGNHFIVQDSVARWLLVSDVFGATFHRVNDEPREKIYSPFKIDGGGRVTYDTYRATFPELAGHISAAANAHTLAVTSPLSFSVFLIALTDER